MPAAKGAGRPRVERAARRGSAVSGGEVEDDPTFDPGIPEPAEDRVDVLEGGSVACVTRTDLRRGGRGHGCGHRVAPAPPSGGRLDRRHDALPHDGRRRHPGDRSGLRHGVAGRSERSPDPLVWRGRAPRDRIRCAGQRLLLIVIPAESPAHLEYAARAPYHPNLFQTPIVGWISGVRLKDLGRVPPRVFDGRRAQRETNRAVVLNAALPLGRVAQVETVNLRVRTPYAARS